MNLFNLMKLILFSFYFYHILFFLLQFLASFLLKIAIQLMYYHEIRLSYKIHAPILTIYASDIWTFSRNRITVNLVWKTQKSNLGLPSCSFAILRCSFTKFSILFIPQYITIILCSFFLVLITFLP